jgi:hypothetical protein
MESGISNQITNHASLRDSGYIGILLLLPELRSKTLLGRCFRNELFHHQPSYTSENYQLHSSGIPYESAHGVL